MGRSDLPGALATELRAPPPAAVLEALDDAEQNALAAAIHAARRCQSVALGAAGERALANLPRLLRAPVRRIVGA